MVTRNNVHGANALRTNGHSIKTVQHLMATRDSAESVGLELKERQKRNTYGRLMHSKRMYRGEKRTYVIDFHHNNPKEKIASISDMRDQQRPIAEIKKEILKTTPLCACCHRELHYLKLHIKQYLKGDY